MKLREAITITIIGLIIGLILINQTHKTPFKPVYNNPYLYQVDKAKVAP